MARRIYGRSRHRKDLILGGLPYADWIKTINGISPLWDFQELVGSVAAAWNTGLLLGRNVAVNGDFSDGLNNWDLTSVGDATSNVVENPAGQCQIISDGTAAGIGQTSLDIGKTYRVRFDVTAVGLGRLKTVGFVADIVTDLVPDSYDFTSVADQADFQLFRNAACDVTVDNIVVEQTDILPSSRFPGANYAPQTYAGYVPFGAEWTNPSAEIAHCDGTQAGETELRVSSLLTIGQSDQYTLVVANIVSGSVWVRAGGIDGVSHTTDGTYVETLTSNGTTFRIKASSDFVGDVNLELQKIQERNPLNGDHTAVTVGVPTGNSNIPYAVTYNGGTSFTDIYSAELNSMFNPDAGTLMVFAKVSGAGVWTDGAARYIVTLEVDASNRFSIHKAAANNQINLFQVAGGTTKLRAATAVTSTDFVMYAMTWDKAAGATGEFIAYLNATQQGAVLTGLGDWVGNLNSAKNVIGAATTTPANVWDGDITYPMLANRALTPAEIAEIWNRSGF